MSVEFIYQFKTIQTTYLGYSIVFGLFNIGNIKSLVNVFPFFFSGRTKNPFVVEPSFEKWAPWTGKKTRMGNTGLNTEYEKVVSPKATSSEAQLLTVSEDRLMDELMKQKV